MPNRPSYTRWLKTIYCCISHFYELVGLQWVVLVFFFFKLFILHWSMDFPDGSVVKYWPANAGDTGSKGSIPGSRKSPEGWNGNPLQYSCLEISMDRGAWWATSPRVARVGHNWATEHCSQLTMLWWYQVDSKGSQPYIHMYPFSPKLPSDPGCHITLSRVPCAIQ